MMDARESRKTPLGWFVAFCGAGLVIAFFVLPIAFLVSVSFKSPDQALSGHFLPGRPTLDNWRDTFQIIPLPVQLGVRCVLQRDLDCGIRLSRDVRDG